MLGSPREQLSKRGIPLEESVWRGEIANRSRIQFARRRELRINSIIETFAPPPSLKKQTFTIQSGAVAPDNFVIQDEKRMFLEPKMYCFGHHAMYVLG